MTAVGLVVAAYLLGSIPSSLIIARLAKGIDLREWGSGNFGSTNLYRAAGAGWASVAVAFDVAKGVVPTRFFPVWDDLEAVQLALAYGGAAVLGHIYSIWVKFRGGKGVATGGGVYLALAPGATAIALAGWLLAVLTTRIVSVGSLLAASILPVTIWLTGHRFDFVFWSTLPLTGLVWWTHRANVARLLAGEELPAQRGVGSPAPEPDPGPSPSGEA